MPRYNILGGKRVGVAGSRVLRAEENNHDKKSPISCNHIFFHSDGVIDAALLF